MSKAGPSTFVVVGETDYWSTQYTHVDFARDSRLRGLRRDYNDSNWRSAVGNASRAAENGKFYAEMLIVAGASNNGFGLVLAGSESTVQTAQLGSVAGSAAMFRGGTIWLNGSSVQSGLPTISAGDTMGLALYRSGGSLLCQFYKNGATQGTAVTLTDGTYRLAATSFFVTHEYFLRVDGDDLQFLPSDSQPWGAAARVADAGGYSPAASLIEAYGSNIGVDAYLRTAKDLSGVDVTGDSARTDRASSGTDLLYWECHIEAAATATKPLVGLVNSAYSMETQYIGATGTASFGYYGTSGDVFINNVSVVTYATFTAADRIGVILDPATGKFWLMKNGTLQAGDPEAGTGQTGTLTDGPWYPAATPYGANARVHFCTHAREQLYRPSYAKAVDGADILPEQHYRDAIVGDTEITTGIWFPFPWGGSRRTGSPLGTVVLDNAGGDYDSLRWYNLRDEELVVYELVDDRPEYLARVVCDSVTMDGEATVSIASRGLDCLLDVHIDEQALLVGRCSGQIPVVPISSTALVWDLSHTPYVVFDTVMDQGVAVTWGTSWVYARSEVAQGFRRLVNPSGKMVGFGATFRPLTQISLTNGDFASWTGDNPDSWTVTESAGTAEIKQNGNAARFHRTSGSATLQISQAITTSIPAGHLDHLFAVITVSAYVSGDIKVAGSDGTYRNVGVNAAGTYVVPFNSYAASTSINVRADDAVTDLSVDTIAIWHGDRTDHRDEAYAWLLETYAGLTSSQYSLESMPSAYSDLVFNWGYWSDQRPTVRQVVDVMNQSLMMDYYTAPNGVLTFVVALNPADQTPSGTLLEIDARGPMTVQDDLAPALTDRFLHSLNFEQYTDAELAGSVTGVNRSNRTRPGTPYRPSQGYHAFYTHANGAPEFPSLQDSSVQYTLAATWADMYADRKWFFDREYDAEKVRSFSPGNYITVKANRFGLSAGEVLMLVSKTRRLKSPLVRCKFWGST